MRSLNLPSHLLDRIAILSDDYYTGFYMNRGKEILSQVNPDSFSKLLKQPYTDIRLLRNLINEFDIELFNPLLAVYDKKCLKILIDAKMTLTLDNFQLKTKSGRIIRSQNSNETPLDMQVFEKAAAVGKLKIMRLLFKNGCEFDAHTFIAAAKQGKLINMQWLHKHGCPCNPKVFHAALDCGRVENVIWLYKVCPIGAAREFGCEIAAKTSNLRLLSWLVKNKFEIDPVVLEKAAFNGDFQMVKFLVENGCEIDAQVAYAAGKSGVINCIRFIHLSSSIRFSEMMDGAADNKNIAGLSWLLANEYERSKL